MNTPSDWNRRIVKVFEDFSDIEFQRRSWFGLGPELSSPDELCNRIDDLLLNTWLDTQGEKIDPYLRSYIADFVEAVDALPETSDPWMAFSSLEWVVLRLKAAVIRDLLAKVVAG